MISTGEEVLVAGNNIQAMDPSEVLEHPLAFYRLDDAPLPGPRGEYLFAFPRLYQLEDGRIGMLWAEPSNDRSRTSLSAWTSNRFATLLAAVRSPSGEWSRPEEVLNGAIAWGPRSRVRESAGYQRFATAVGNAFGGASVAVGVERGGEWSVALAEVPSLRQLAYTSLAATDGRLALAVIAGSSVAEGAEVNSVWFASSEADRVNWTEPVLIHPAHSEPSHDVQLLADDAGGLDVIWVQQTDTGRILQHADSQDGGTSWGPVSGLRIPEVNVHHAQGLRDACGGIHVFFTAEHQLTGFTTIGYATWDDSGWSIRSNPFPDLYSTDPSLVSADGVTWITFLGRHAADPRGTPMSVFSASTSALMLQDSR